jgi:hypothetical protein
MAAKTSVKLVKSVEGKSAARGVRVSTRKNPRKNKSLAIRTIIAAYPEASGAEVVDRVKKKFGLDVTANVVYMIKTKLNKEKELLGGGDFPATGNVIQAVRLAQQLVSTTGSVNHAVALLRALQSQSMTPQDR